MCKCENSNSVMEIENHFKNEASLKESKVQIERYLVLLAFLFITNLAFAQANLQDIVHLKNGSIIRGVIIEQVPNQSIKIQTADRNVFVYQMDEIEKLTKELYQGRGGNSFNNSNSGLQSGYKGIVELGYQIGAGNFGMDRLKLNIINGYQINPYFSLGFGTGLRYYFDADAVLIPAFANFRTNFIDNKTSPYLSLGLGYSFDATNGFNGAGIFLNPTVGVSFMISDKSAVNVGLGYEMQKMKYYSGSYYYNVTTVNSGALSIAIGISF